MTIKNRYQLLFFKLLFVFSSLSISVEVIANPPALLEVAMVSDAIYVVTIPPEEAVRTDRVVQVIHPDLLKIWPKHTRARQFLMKSKGVGKGYFVVAATPERLALLIEDSTRAWMTHWIRKIYRVSDLGITKPNWNFTKLIMDLAPLIELSAETVDTSFSPRALFGSSLKCENILDQPLTEAFSSGDPTTLDGYSSPWGAGPAGHTGLASRLVRSFVMSLFFTAGFGGAYHAHLALSENPTELSAATISLAGGAALSACALYLERIFNRRP